MSPKAYAGAGLAMLMMASLPACSPSGSADAHLPLTGAKYCTPFAATAAGGNTVTGLAQAPDPATAFDDCVHRWAYALAPARDPADVVAQASVDACGTALNAWSQQAVGGEAPPPGVRSQSEASSAMAQQMRGAEARALFYVVQARAAGCAPPPANTLTTSPPG
jgi:hypothetical protein